MEALLFRNDEFSAAIELIDDLEYGLLTFFGRGVRMEQSPNSQMSLGTRFWRHERVGCFLCAVVCKPIGVLRADDEFELQSIPKCCFGSLPGGLKNGRKHGRLRAISDAGKLLECGLSRGRKPVQLVDHEIHDVVGVTLGVNGIQIPAPARFPMCETDQPFLNQGLNKLSDEKRVAGSFPVDELRQRRRALRVTMKRVCNQTRQVARAQRRQADLLHGGPG